jgi:hypothetical protein
MRLGKEKAAGYVEDTENVSETDELINDPERQLATPEPEPVVSAG